LSGGYAELIADGGAAAVETEFFRSSHFLEAEAVTHTLRIEAGGIELLAPLQVRPIGDTPDLDATTPYGYPGFSCVRSSPPHAGISANAGEGESLPAIDPSRIDFSATNLVSAFVRHRLDLVPLAGATERNVVQIADPALSPKSRPSDRRQVRRNLEAGYTVELVAGTATTAEQRAGFLEVYEQTMRRTEAGAHYFFGGAYFDLALAARRTWLCLAREPGGAIAAASIAVVSDGCIHYYLSGSADANLGDSPMKNVVARLVELAGELELPLNLGGGMSAGDALEEFKRGFANRTLSWRTSELVCDPGRYAELSAGRGGGGFIPPKPG
jgi:hypothetical protein